MRALCFVTLALLAACRGDETLSRYGASGTTWVLGSLDGVPFRAAATIGFPAEGQIVGTTPCGSFTATQMVPYPWFAATDITLTGAPCMDAAEEARFVAALAAMSVSEVGPDTLILSNDAGREMVFTASG